MNRTMLAIACLTFIAAAGAAHANPDALGERMVIQSQSPPSSSFDERVKDFGPGGVYHSSAEGSQMQARTSAMTYELGTTSAAYYCTTTGPANIAYGQFYLPHGVSISFMRAWLVDSDSSNRVEVELESACLPDFGAAFPVVTSLGTVATTNAFSGGDFSASAAVPGFSVIVDNQSCTYRVRALVGTPACGANIALGVYKTRLQWQRVIPAAPASASFTDVPTGHPFFQVIEALAASGVTAGCTATQFCPDSAVTRSQMAAFLARALGLQPTDIADPANP